MNDIDYLLIYLLLNGDWGLGIGDWGLGNGALAHNPNPQTPNPKKKNIIYKFFLKIFYF